MNRLQTIRKVLDIGGYDHVDTPNDLFQCVAAEIKGHDEFRKLLGNLKPEQRNRAYSTLFPYLKFVPMPLDVYIAQNQNEAERKQLPVIQKDGSLKQYYPPELESVAYVAQKALEKALLRHHLVVQCRKCLKVEEFHGDRKIDAIVAAREAGWAYDAVNEWEMCPTCLGAAAK